MSQRDETNYYDILEVAPTASQSEIHRAYQRARETYAVDNPALYGMFSPEEARELLKLIDEAYSILCNQAARKLYDDKMFAKTGSPSHAAVVSEQRAPIASMSPVPSAIPAEAQPIENAPVNETVISDDGEFVVRKRETQKSALPAGMGRTAFGTYKIDENFEAELKAMTDFDGGVLQKIRTYKNIGLDKMSEATRISRTYLTAVEKNDYKNLPAAVFVRGFIVQVARVLGLDDTKVATSYMKIFKAGGGK
jgi:curved DNA-binding protein CbpA